MVSLEKTLALISSYRVTQNKVHHLLAILHLTFEVNITQVSYVIQCIIATKVEFNKVQFWKWLSESNISNCAVIWQTTRFEISLNIFHVQIFSDIKKMSEQFKCLKIAFNKKKIKIHQDHLKLPSYCAIWDNSNTKKYLLSIL